MDFLWEREPVSPVHVPGRVAPRFVPAAGMAALLIIGGVWSGAIRHDPSPAFLAR